MIINKSIKIYIYYDNKKTRSSINKKGRKRK